MESGNNDPEAPPANSHIFLRKEPHVDIIKHMSLKTSLCVIIIVKPKREKQKCIALIQKTLLILRRESVNNKRHTPVYSIFHKTRTRSWNCSLKLWGKLWTLAISSSVICEFPKPGYFLYKSTKANYLYSSSLHASKSKQKE